VPVSDSLGAGQTSSSRIFGGSTQSAVNPSSRLGPASPPLVAGAVQAVVTTVDAVGGSCSWSSITIPRCRPLSFPFLSPWAPQNPRFGHVGPGSVGILFSDIVAARPPPFPSSLLPYFGPDLGRELWRPPPPPASGSRYVALGSLVFSVCRLFFFDTDGRDRRCVRRASPPPPLLRSRPPSERLCGHRSRRDHLFAGAVPDLWTWAWLLS
jgi:hypothetical protein